MRMAAARLEAVITTPPMDGAARSSGWCRKQGVYPNELERWRAAATQAMARELRRQDKALSGTAALLVLSKALSAIFHEGEDE